MQTIVKGDTRAHIFIEGKVQGVGFRNFIQRKAHTMDVTGWVKNLRDGRVEAVFEGEKMDVDQMIEACFDGPPAANVHNVEEEWEEPESDISGFDIKL